MYIQENLNYNNTNISQYINEHFIFHLLNNHLKANKSIEILAMYHGEILRLKTQIQEISFNDKTFITKQFMKDNLPVNINAGTKVLVQLQNEHSQVQFPAELIMVSGNPPELMFCMLDFII